MIAKMNERKQNEERINEWINEQKMGQMIIFCIEQFLVSQLQNLSITVRGNYKQTNWIYLIIVNIYKLVQQMPRRENNWSEEENRLFQEAIMQHGQCWKSIRKYVRDRSISQIRSHAQKYIPQWIKRLKLQHQQQNIPNRRYSRQSNPAPAEFVPPPYLVARPIRVKRTRVPRIRRLILNRNNQNRQENPAPQRGSNQIIAPQQNEPNIPNFRRFNPVPRVEERYEPAVQIPLQRLISPRILTTFIIIQPQDQLNKERSGREE